ncbi:MAG: response regulator transcription factor [Candidatus Gastranaerophilales bacterium]|nr:response regulator transcription factor [Candidatus Gastranaerophilales bacterium]
MPSVIVADDEVFVRDFLKNLLASIHFDVIAEVERGDVLPFIIAEKKPDILLLDINMPNLTGIEFLKLYRKNFPDTCIIILTSPALQSLADEAVLAGADCFLKKDTPVDKIIATIKQTWENFKK